MRLQKSAIFNLSLYLTISELAKSWGGGGGAREPRKTVDDLISVVEPN